VDEVVEFVELDGHHLVVLLLGLHTDLIRRLLEELVRRD